MERNGPRSSWKVHTHMAKSQMSPETKLGSFSTYLEAAVAASKGEEVPTASSSNPDQALGLFNLVATHPGIRLSDLQQQFGQDFRAFALHLSWLSGSGLISVSGDPGSESADLTEIGRQLSVVSARLPQTA
jgi:hypothetical protein